MANYSQLKTAINAAITANGQNEITGTVLNNVLKTMVTSIGSGYLFKGVATPSTAPGTPDQNVFYVGGKGTYSNFGSTPVTIGAYEIGFFKYNGTWSNEKVTLTVDEQVTATSDNLITSGAVAEAITNALNEGYLFKGVATPSMTPAERAHKIFYLAVEGGTYTNFKNYGTPITVQDGISIIYGDVTWIPQLLVGIDDNPTSASDNLVRSGGINSTITEQLKRLSGELEWVGGVGSGVKQYYRADGTINNMSSVPRAGYYGTAEIDVSEFIGLTIGINTFCSTTGDGAVKCLFVKEDNTVIEYWNQNGYTEKTVPVEANKLLLSNLFALADESPVNPYPFIIISNISELYSNISELYGRVTNLDSKLISDEEKFGKHNQDFLRLLGEIEWTGGIGSGVKQYYRQDATIANLSNVSTAWYFGTSTVNVEDAKGKTIGIFTICGTSGYGVVKCLFVREDNSVIEYWNQNGYLEKTVPTDAKYLLLSNIFAYADETPVCPCPFVIKYKVNELGAVVSKLTKERILIGNDNFYEKTLNLDNDETHLIVPDEVNGYNYSWIENPIPNLRITSVRIAKKVSGSNIYSFAVNSSNIGVWLRLSDYTSTIAFHAIAHFTTSAMESIIVNFDIHSGLLEQTNTNGSGISNKVRLIKKEGDYGFFSIKVTTTNPLFDYSTIFVYETGGNVLNREYLTVVLDNIDEPYLAPYKIKVQELITPKYCKLCLPDKIIFEAGKEYYLFKRSMFVGWDYKKYNIQAFIENISQTSEDDPIYCKDYDRYIRWAFPTEAEVPVSIILFDESRNVIDKKEVIFKTVVGGSPSSAKTLLFIGDSLTYYNRITDEFYRILTSSDSASVVQDTISIYQVKKPAGRSWNNINLIGTQKIDYRGWIGQTYHEGHSGWAWKNFISVGSPFIYNSALDFSHYIQSNNFATPDIIYIGLGWNDQKYVEVLDGGKVINVQPVINNAKVFLDALTSQLPNTKIRLWTENISGIHGGIGNHIWGAVEWADEQRINLIQFALIEAYKSLIESYENVELVMSTLFVDSEYSLQEEYADINTRITDDEVRGKDYVHPADSGFFQIADSLIADFCSLV